MPRTFSKQFQKDHLVSNLENEIDQYLRGVERHRTLEKLAESAPPHIGSSRGATSSYLCTGLRSLGQHSVCTVLIHRKTCVIFDSRHLEAKQQQNKATPGPGQFTLPMAPDSRLLRAAFSGLLRVYNVHARPTLFLFFLVVRLPPIKGHTKASGLVHLLFRYHVQERTKSVCPSVCACMGKESASNVESRRNNAGPSGSEGHGGER